MNTPPDEAARRTEFEELLKPSAQLRAALDEAYRRAAEKAGIPVFDNAEEAIAHLQALRAQPPHD